MRVRDVQRQFRYWARFPTARDMLAARYGVKDPGAPSHATPFTAEESAELDRLNAQAWGGACG